MRIKHLIACLLAVAAAASAQSDSSMAITHTLAPYPPPGKFDSLPAEPTAQEIADLFYKAGGDIQEAVDEVASRGAVAINALTSLLSDESIRVGDLPPNSTERLRPDRVHALIALEHIQDPQAAYALSEVALSSTDVDVRGIAIRALARNKFSSANMFDQDTRLDIVRAFIRNIGDESFSPALQSDISSVAREGVLQWLGIDFGDPKFKRDRISAGSGTEVTAAEFARIWFENNASRLIWNAETKKLALN